MVTCFRLLCVTPVSIFPTLHHIHLYLSTTVIGTTSGQNLGAFEQNNTFPDIVAN